jgi:hypothetical protein
MTSLEIIDEDTLNSILEKSHLKMSPESKKRIKDDLKDQLRLSRDNIADNNWNSNSNDFNEPKMNVSSSKYIGNSRNEGSWGQLAYNTEFSLHHISRVDPKFNRRERKDLNKAAKRKDG